MSIHHETRLAIEAYRERRRTVRRLKRRIDGLEAEFKVQMARLEADFRREIKPLADLLSEADEAACNAEAIAAAMIQDHGSQEIDGRRYEHERSSELGAELNRLRVSPVDAYLMKVGERNCPEIAP